MDNNQVTIVTQDSVRLAVMDEVGRAIYHVRYLDGAMAGNLEPSATVNQLRIEHENSQYSVLPTWRFDLLAEQAASAQGLLVWMADRQVASALATEAAMVGVEKKVDAEMKKWEKAFARPKRAPMWAAVKVEPLPDVTGTETPIEDDPVPDPSTIPEVPDPAAEPDPPAEEEQTEAQGAFEKELEESMQDDAEEPEPAPPAEPGSYNIGDKVLRASDFEPGDIIKVDEEDGTAIYFVSIRGAYPEEFKAEDLMPTPSGGE